MSTTPPGMPPGGGVPPPYDPKMQWRAYREQQKASWRAQRDAWRAQRHAWKAGYMGPYGPRVPSMVGPLILVTIGVVALLVMTGHISAGVFWAWYGQWWPALLIVAGLALLGEWFLDMRRETPVRRSGSFVGILLLIAFLGILATGWNHLGPFANSWGGNNDFFNFFGLPEHDFDQPAETRPIPANASIQIFDPRGDVSITAADQPNIEVQAHETAYASSDSDAKKIFDSEAAKVTVSGTAVLVQSDGNDHGRVNLTVTGRGLPGRHRRAVPVRRIRPAGRSVFPRRDRGVGGDRHRGLPRRRVRLEFQREAGRAGARRAGRGGQRAVPARLSRALCRTAAGGLAGPAGDAVLAAVRHQRDELHRRAERAGRRRGVDRRRLPGRHRRDA